MPTIEHVDHILLIKLRAIGDSVLTLASLEELRRGFPHARITVMFPEHSTSLLEADPRADEVLAYPRARLKTLKDHAGFFESLGPLHVDLAVCLHASFRSALIGWMSGAWARSVRNHSGRDWFSNRQAVEPKEPKSIIQRDFDALRALGLKPSEKTLPRLAIPASARARARHLAAQKKLPKGRTLLLFPGAGKPEKRWPLGRFEVLRAALKKKKTATALMLAPGEVGPADAIRIPGLLDLGAFCAHAGWALGNDSGPRHIAAASGARTFTLFGPEGLREWQPYSPEQGHLAMQAPSGDILDLPADEVVQRTLEWLHASKS